MILHAPDGATLHGRKEPRRGLRVDVDANRTSSWDLHPGLDNKLGPGVYRDMVSHTVRASDDRCILCGRLSAEQKAASDRKKGGEQSVGQCSATREEPQK